MFEFPCDCVINVLIFGIERIDFNSLSHKQMTLVNLWLERTPPSAFNSFQFLINHHKADEESEMASN